MAENIYQYGMSLPDPYASDEVKASKEYIFSFAKYMERKSLGVDGGLYNQKVARFSMNRLYAQGLQPVEQYVPRVGLENKQSAYANISWKITSPAPKFIEIITNGMMKREEKVTATNLDPLAAKEKTESRTKSKFMLRKKQDIAQLEEMSGLNLMPDVVREAESDAEIDLYFDLNNKQTEEIVFEEILQLILNENRYPERKRRIIRDLIECGIAATRTFIDYKGRVTIKRVKPENLVTSYTEEADFENAVYVGEVLPMTLHDLKLSAGTQFTEAEYEDIANRVKSIWGNGNKFYNNSSTYANNTYRPYDDSNVMILQGYYITTRTQKFEKKGNKYGGFTINKRASDYTPPTNSEFPREMIEKKDKVVYKFNLVLQTDYMFDFGLETDMIKSPTDLSEVALPITVYMPNAYQMNNKPLIEMMIPTIDQMQIIRYKLQILIAKARPAGIAIAIDGLEDINLGDGKNLSPLEIQDVYDQTGNYYYRAVNEDGMYKQFKPIEALPNGMGNQLQELIATYNYLLDALRGDTGLNEAADGAAVDARAGYRTTQMALTASNNATSYIYDSFVDIMNRTLKKAAVLVQDIVCLKKQSYEGYAKVVGQDDLKFIQLNKEYANINFGVALEMLPDDAKKEELARAIDISIQAGVIKPSDKYMLMSIPNIKVAYQYLKIMENKYRKEKQEDAKANTDYAVQQNAAAAQAKAQGDAQIVQLKESVKGEVLVAVEAMKGQMAQQLAVLNEILKQNSSREQKILDETPLAIITAAAQQQQQDQAMAPQEEAQGMPEEQDPNEPQGMPEEQEMGNNTPQMMS
jgi:hypothetical protein